jgi:hypothetical protein
VNIKELKEADVRAGIRVVADGGFTCIPEGASLTVYADDDGEFFVHCQSGRHYLDGQLENGRFIGMRLADVERK